MQKIKNKKYFIRLVEYTLHTEFSLQAFRPLCFALLQRMRSDRAFKNCQRSVYSCIKLNCNETFAFSTAAGRFILNS